MTFLTTKNPSQWINPSGQGYIFIIGLLNFQDNLGNLLVTNSLNQLVTNPLKTSPKFLSAWSGSGV